MAKPTASLTLRALVPIPTGTLGWTGKDVDAGADLTTTDGALVGELVRLGYAADSAPPPSPVPVPPGATAVVTLTDSPDAPAS